MVNEFSKIDNHVKECEKRWRLALEGGQFGIWEFNITGKEFIDYNNWIEVLGYFENVISYEEWEKLIYPDDLPIIRLKYNNYFNGEDFVIEYRIMCKNGEYKWIRAKGKISEWSEDGKPIRMVGTNEDITERKQIEEELKEKCRQLEILKQEAENANKAKSQFLANMSHEIRTPMNGILGVIQLLQLTNMNKKQETYIKIMKESSDTLLAIINDVLDISKIESGMIHLKNEPFDLKETISSIYNNLMVMGNSKGLEISYYLDPNIDFEIIGDELKLKQILTNLISNAIKFTDTGYVSFTIKVLSSDHEFEKIEFRVKDSGIGIKDGIKDKIFENFIQGDLSSKKKYIGTGLGLAISKQLATLMNGAIWFESLEGQGSTFYFTCEFKRVNTSKDQKQVNYSIQEINKISNKGKTILSVEDNLINQEVLEDIIQRMGYNFIATYNGKEALNILKNSKVDLILMDVQMPEMNGYKTTEIIRKELENHKNVPIIAMTAYGMREDKNKCIEAGMDDYISKPFELDSLISMINFYLGE